jgi:hypothetical protein
MSQPLITVDAALYALASATTLDELINFANHAAALQIYARRTEARGTTHDDTPAARVAPKVFSSGTLFPATPI